VAVTLVRGSIAIIAMRVVLLVLAALPTLVMLGSAIASDPARRPYFTDVEGRLPIVHLLRFFEQLPSLSAPIALGVVIALLGEQVLVAGALAWLGPRAERKAGVFGRVLQTGFSWLGPMLRVMLGAAVLVVAGSWAIDRLLSKIGSYGEVANWSGYTLGVLLPFLQGIATLLWTALVGAWAFWCRVVCIASERRQVRSAARVALFVFWRAPWRAPLFFVSVTVGSFLASAAVLIIWRQLPPPTVGHVIFIALVWLLTLVAQAWLWHWLLRSARLLYATKRFADLHTLPDLAFEPRVWLRRLVTRR